MSRASLNRETGDVWRWYLRFFKRVIELDKDKDLIQVQGEQREPSHGGSEHCQRAQSPYGPDGIKRKIVTISDKPVDVYSSSRPKAVPSKWFINGKRLKNQQSDALLLDFSVRIYREKRKDPVSSGFMNSPKLHIKIAMDVYVGKDGHLNYFVIHAVSPWAKGSIAHELKHLWNKHYFPAANEINKLQRTYTAKMPVLLPFAEWLLYFGECMETSAHVDQIARYARDKKVTSMDGFNAIIRDKIGIKGKIALGKGEKFKGSMEKLVRNIIDNQVTPLTSGIPGIQF
jgi:hypothetical protein